MQDETKIPISLLRRITFIDLPEELKRNSLRAYRPGVSLSTTLQTGIANTSYEVIPWHDANGVDFDENAYAEWLNIFQRYLMKTYGEQTKEYLSKVFQPKYFNEDGYIYVFYKHSELDYKNRKGRGYRWHHNTWGELIIRDGWSFPLNWWEIKSKVDANGLVTILRPGDKYNKTGFYYTVTRQSNIKESIKRMLKEQDEKILEIPGFFFFNNDWNLLMSFLNKRGNPKWKMMGSLMLKNTHHVTTLNNLVSVEKNLSIVCEKLTTLGSLESVGGWLDLSLADNLESFGNLKSVRANLYLGETPISKKYTEEEIRQIIDIGGYIVYD